MNGLVQPVHVGIGGLPLVGPFDHPLQDTNHRFVGFSEPQVLRSGGTSERSKTRPVPLFMVHAYQWHVVPRFQETRLRNQGSSRPGLTYGATCGRSPRSPSRWPPTGTATALAPSPWSRPPRWPSYAWSPPGRGRLPVGTTP